MLDGPQRGKFVVLQYDLAVLRADEETDVEESVRELRVARFGLGSDVRAPVLSELAQELGLGPWVVDCTLSRVIGVVEVEDLVGEPLQPTLRDGDEPHRQVHARQPARRRSQLCDVLQVGFDLLAAADASHGHQQANSLIGLDHEASPSSAAR